MKKQSLTKLIAMGLTVSAVLATTGCNEETGAAATAEVAPAVEPALDSEMQKISYIIGYTMGKQAESNNMTFDTDVVAMAIKDVVEGVESRISEEEQREIMNAFQEKIQEQRRVEREKMKEEQEKMSEENLKVGQEYLTANAAKEGVKSTESGLQYKVLTAVDAEGAVMPKDSDSVKVHYHGTLIDGSVFDSSVERGEPVTFPVKGVIQGWVEGLQLMKEGEKFEFVIPAELAYGKRSPTPKIGPNSVLRFEVELLDVIAQGEEGAAEAPNPHAGH